MQQPLLLALYGIFVYFISGYTMERTIHNKMQEPGIVTFAFHHDIAIDNPRKVVYTTISSED